jgi:hypothetical protein
MAAALVAASCSGDDDGGTDVRASETTPDECINTAEATEPVNTGSLADDLLELSREIFSCAPTVVTAQDDDPAIVAAAADLATHLRAPVLMPGVDPADALDSWETADVYVVHDTPDDETPGPVPTSGTEDRSYRLVNLEAVADIVDADDGDATPENGQATSTADVVAAAVVTVDDPQVTWLVDASDPLAVHPLAALGTIAGAGVVPVDGTDLLAHPGPSAALQALPDDQPIRHIGAIPTDAEWELNLLRSGHRLPGGGHEAFPEDMPLRFIAYYGHPDTTGMGVLGKQDGPHATYQAMQPLLEEYDTGDAVVVPTFNPIVTVAHNGGSTGQPDNLFEANRPYYVDYSTMHPPARFTEYVDAADEIDGYVLLDFQPGRNTFLYQVQQYDELIRHPRVGVALDPEWRLKSGERHLTQIGSVSASELNDVINYLADMVRDEGLPQKVVMLHQFRLDMITDRDQLVDRDEIALVIQMDGEGQGGLSVKDATWNAITAGTEDAHWNWGWKNFTERDTPRTNTPEETMSKRPQPVFVSYQ